MGVTKTCWVHSRRRRFSGGRREGRNRVTRGRPGLRPPKAVELRTRIHLLPAYRDHDASDGNPTYLHGLNGFETLELVQLCLLYWNVACVMCAPSGARYDTSSEFRSNQIESVAGQPRTGDVRIAPLPTTSVC